MEAIDGVPVGHVFHKSDLLKSKHWILNSLQVLERNYKNTEVKFMDANVSLERNGQNSGIDVTPHRQA
jgi:hypothetical protein